MANRDRSALRQDGIERAVKLYAKERSAEWVAEELDVAASTDRHALKEACVPVRPGGQGRHEAGAP